MIRRRLLIVAFHYPPIQGSSGVHRALAFSKFLPEFGWDVSVLTVAPGAHERIHPDHYRLVPDHVEVIRARAWDAARHFAIRGRYPSALARPDRWSSWIPFGTWVGNRALQARRFDAIFSTFPIASAHIIGRNLHSRSGLPWVADFRDPMATLTYPHDEGLRRLWMKIQDSVVHNASRIVTTTPGAAQFYRRMYPDVSPERFVAIENGFDPDAFQKAGGARPPDLNSMTLLHSGVMYPRERDPRPFFRALRRLLDAGVIARDTLRVRLRASGFEEQYRAMLAEYDLSSVVSLDPATSYTDALREMQEVAGLLLFQAQNCNEQIPAKAYEYLFAGRPILGLTDPEGDTGRLLTRFGVPGVAALEDEEAIVGMLATALPKIRSGEYPLADRRAVMSVSRRAGAEQLAAMLDQVLAKASSGA